MCYAINNTVKAQYKQCAQLQVSAINKCATEKGSKYNVRNCIVRKVGLLKVTVNL